MTDNTSIDGKLATADELYSVIPQPRVMSVKAETGTGDLTKVGTRTGTGIGVGKGTGVARGRDKGSCRGRDRRRDSVSDKGRDRGVGRAMSGNRGRYWA